MPLFEVAIIEKPTPKGIESGETEKLIFGPKAVIASDIQSAAVSAVLGEASLSTIDKSRMEILVRPFASSR